MPKIYIKGFAGVNTDKLPTKLVVNKYGISELADCLNMDLNNDYSLSQRKGSTLVNIFSNNAYLLKFDEIRDGALNEIMLAIDGTTLYRYDDSTGTFVSKATNLTAATYWGGVGYVGDFVFSNRQFTYRFYYDTSLSDYKVEILSYDYENDGSSYIVNIVTSDVVYNNDGNSVNGDDKTYYQAKVAQTGIDLSTEDFSNTTNWEKLGTSPIVPNGLYWEQFDNRLFCCGDGTENLYYSEQGDGTSWDALDFIALGAKPTALKQVGEFLFVGTDRGIIKVKLTGDSTAPYILTWLTKDGILNNSLVEVTSGLVGCLTDTGRYLIFDQYTQDTSQIDIKVGLPIRPTILDIDDTFMVSLKHKNQIIYACKVDSDYKQLVLNNVVFGWTFYDLNIKSMIEYDGVVYYSDYSKNVMKLASGVYQDNGTDFSVYAVTPIYDDDKPEFMKNFRRINMVSNSETKVNIRMYYNVLYTIIWDSNRSDDKEILASGADWGSVKWGEFIWGGVYAQVPLFRVEMTGRGLQLKITKTTSNSDLKIQDLVIEYYPAYQQGAVS